MKNFNLQLNQMSSLQNNDNNESKTENKPTSTKLTTKNINLNHLHNYAYGLTIGAGIGDSIGSYLEFTSGDQKSEVIDHAMKMPGGGTWGSRVKPGQVTDDTELAISLCRGLIQIIDTNNKNNNTNNSNSIHHIFDCQPIANEYHNWYDSNPFDIGGCTSTTLCEAPYVPHMKKAAFEYNSMMTNQYKNSGNMANGSLMRCMSLIVYGYKLSRNQLFQIMTEDSSLTHSNPVVFIVNTVYAIVAQYLLQTHSEFMENEEKKDDNINISNNYVKKRNINAFLIGEKWLLEQMVNDKNNKEYFKEVYEWLTDCKQNNILKLHCATEFIGFIKIGFQRAFYHLWNETDFKTAIRMTISEGGDTDTNGC
eukprot:187776_1